MSGRRRARGQRPASKPECVSGSRGEHTPIGCTLTFGDKALYLGTELLECTAHGHPVTAVQPLRGVVLRKGTWEWVQIAQKSVNMCHTKMTHTSHRGAAVERDGAARGV